jgi:hypothetical protein
MEPPRRAGRIIGILILIQMVGGGLVNGVLEAPLFDAPGFLSNAAPYSRQIALAVVLALITEALWLGIAVTAFNVVFRRTRALALWFIALAVVTLTVAVVENIGVMSMLSVSEAYSKAGAVEREQFEVTRVVVASGRNWGHYIGRICDGGVISMLYCVLYRLKLVPRVLAGFGLLAVVLMITSVAMPLFGHEVVFPMLAPIGVSQLILAIWLIAKGFRDPASPRTERATDEEPSDLHKGSR